MPLGIAHFCQATPQSFSVPVYILLTTCISAYLHLYWLFVSGFFLTLIVWLVVGDSGHIFDDNAVVRMLAFLVQNMICLNHIINNIGLRDLFGAELLLGAQILAIVVS